MLTKWPVTKTPFFLKPENRFESWSVLVVFSESKPNVIGRPLVPLRRVRRRPAYRPHHVDARGTGRSPLVLDDHREGAAKHA
jgi:hypothetical protein